MSVENLQTHLQNIENGYTWETLAILADTMEHMGNKVG